ncbi:Cytochrome P450 93A3 [Nymphaea thermarum]|nr:Cytochrome P450 93A3 [Nymphaea thermarum]
MDAFPNPENRRDSRMGKRLHTSSGWTLPLDLLLVVGTDEASFWRRLIDATMEIAYSFCNSSIIVSFIFLVIIFCRFLSSRSTLRLPPSPPSLPILGHSHLLLGSTPHSALQKLSIRYGPLLYLRIGCVPVVVASSPSLAREFLKVHGSSFSSRPHITLLDTLLYGRDDFAFAPVGPLWKTMRKTCMVELLGGRSLGRFSFIRQQEMGCFLRAMMASAGEPVDVSAKFGELTGNILVRMATGRRIKKASRVLDLVQEASEIGGQFYLGDYFKFMSKCDVQGYKKKCRDIHERLDGLMEEVVKEHQSRRIEKTVEGKDIIDVLLQSIKEDKEEGGITKENVKSLILSIDMCTN